MIGTLMTLTSVNDMTSDVSQHGEDRGRGHGIRTSTGHLLYLLHHTIENHVNSCLTERNNTERNDTECNVTERVT